MPEEKERFVLFGSGHPVVLDEPTICLLDNLLGDLSREERVGQLKRAILKSWKHDKATIGLVEAMEKLLEKDDDFGVDLRTLLRNIYLELPKTTKDWRKTCGGAWDNCDVDATLQLKLALLGRILAGWSWTNDYAGGGKFNYLLLPDAEKCFLFLCETYNSAVRGGEVQKGILDLFRQHLEPNKGRGWEALCLDPWILRKKVPSDIQLVLLKARTRLGGVEVGLPEMQFLSSFGFHKRSSSAVTLAQKVLTKVRDTDELAQKLVALIQPHDRFHIMPTALIKNGNITVVVVSESVARLIIEFTPSRLKAEKEEYPSIISGVQRMRDDLLGEVENPPTILIEATGPNGFQFKEG